MSRAQPHLAYIAWGFPPSRSGGTYRQLATANTFAAAGWRVTVITVNREVFTQITGADTSLEERIDPRIEVIRTRFPWPLRNPDRATWSLPHRALPRVWHKARVAFELAVFPEVHYATWLRTVYRALRHLARQTPVDLVIASGNPFVGFAAAHRFWRRTKVPYVLDYRDAWILDQFTGRQRFGDQDRRAKLERRFVADAAQVWFVNQGTLEWHAARYPAAAERMRVVANGWDPGLSAAAVPDAASVPQAANLPDAAPHPLTFGYLGTISVKVPIKELVEGWRLAKADRLLPADARLVIAGYLGYFGGRPDRASQPTADLLAAAGPDGVEFIGPVPKAQVAGFYEDLDGLVLAIDAGRYVTTGKVFEYVATGKPIVSVHPPEAAASDVLRGYSLWAPVDELTPKAVATALGRAAALARGLTPAQTKAALEHAQAFRRDRQLAPVVKELTELVEAR
ncbi:MAG: glycosyltransferase [Bifidobacteriaceae bacterium]|jgi:glycosyltransferase involved in cell wall biosynthesis|nr:glycosyltransferase [Bifidobacteriaceae bacterium]